TVVRAPDAAAQLMQLRQAESVRAVDDDGVGAGYVDARFDDGGAQQDVEAAMIEIEHDRFQLALVHLAVGDADVRFRQDFSQLTGLAFNVPDLVVHVVDLPATADLAAAGFLDQRRVAARDEGLDRQPRFRRRGDDGQVAQAGQAHVERARNGRGRQRQQIDARAQTLDALL